MVRPLKKHFFMCVSSLTDWLICHHNALKSHLNLVPGFRACFLIWTLQPDSFQILPQKTPHEIKYLLRNAFSFIDLQRIELPFKYFTPSPFQTFKIHIWIIWAFCVKQITNILSYNFFRTAIFIWRDLFFYLWCFSNFRRLFFKSWLCKCLIRELFKIKFMTTKSAEIVRNLEKKGQKTILS